MKYLITGFSGFVGHYLINYINEQEKEAQIIGIDIINKVYHYNNFVQYTINLLNFEELSAIIKTEKPDYIVHLASFSSVAYSWQNPVESFKNNTNIFLNLVESVRLFSSHSIILSVGSSDEYGIIEEKDLPLTENKHLNPVSPYAVARVSQEFLSKIYYNGFKMNIICTRSFNHVGAGQSDQFVVSSIGKKFVEYLKNKKNKIFVGNIDIVRDFLDVRDVVRAYFMLLKKGQIGDIYNVCSGKSYSIKQIIELYKDITLLNPPIEIDKALLRPIENPIVLGSYEKIKTEINWAPKIDLKDSLKTIITYWENIT
ncbi:MAG: GDP-mannose 4,6-dehydratase [Desulfobacterales bacterium]|nr:GDP-mannose 4,6-dehydratase [Desulfobacterales bacterium]